VGDGEMPRLYDIQFAQCPFFISSGKKNVLCEGITDDCTINLKFTSEEKRDQHRRIFCDARYRYCEIFNLLEKKYED
jgi:hypothetical protein